MAANTNKYSVEEVLAEVVRNGSDSEESESKDMEEDTAKDTEESLMSKINEFTESVRELEPGLQGINSDVFKESTV